MFKSTGFLRFVVIVAGLFYTVSGMALIFAPGWFYTYFAHFPPYNRHFLGDAGAFALALGLGLFMIRRRPWEHHSLYIVVLAASLVHAANHLYDAIVFVEPLHHWLTDVLPVSLMIVLLLMAWPALQEQRRKTV